MRRSSSKPAGAVFDSFAGADGQTGWLFGARCDRIARGKLVRFDLPLGTRLGGLLQGVARIVAVRRPSRIVLEHESPWRGTIGSAARQQQADFAVTAWGCGTPCVVAGTQHSLSAAFASAGASPLTV